MSTTASTLPRSIFFEGPCSGSDATGEELPVWFVFIGDAEGDPIEKVSQFSEFETAESFARELVSTRHLPLVSDAVPD